MSTSRNKRINGVLSHDRSSACQPVKGQCFQFSVRIGREKPFGMFNQRPIAVGTDSTTRPFGSLIQSIPTGHHKGRQISTAQQSSGRCCDNQTATMAVPCMETILPAPVHACERIINLAAGPVRLNNIQIAKNAVGAALPPLSPPIYLPFRLPKRCCGVFFH